MTRGKFVSKPLVHFLPGVNVTACGLQAHTPRRAAGGDYHATTTNPGEVTCWSCKRTIAWKKARG